MRASSSLSSVWAGRSTSASGRLRVPDQLTYGLFPRPWVSPFSRMVHGCFDPGFYAFSGLSGIAPENCARSVIFILVADKVQLAGLDLMRHAPVLQRFLAAMRDPHFGRLELANGHGELVPVGMVGDDQRELDVTLARSL